jgi:hypothetical protein
MALVAGLTVLLATGLRAETATAGQNVSVITGNGSYATRYQTAQRLRGALSENEIQQLVIFLQREKDVLGVEELNALKNEVVNVLRRQPGFEEELTELLIQMHTSVGTDEVWKDYCIQHLGGLFGKVGPDLRGQAAELFYKATEIKSGSLCGTALLALNANAAFPEIDKKKTGDIALQVATSGDWGAPARVTAIQICSQLNDKAVLPVARRILSDGNQDAMLRMSALAAVGVLGDSGDLQEINRLGGSDDFRIKQAAAAAAKRIQNRGEEAGRKNHETE